MTEPEPDYDAIIERATVDTHTWPQSPLEAEAIYNARSPSTKSNLIEVSGEIKQETEKAYRFYDGERTVWLPKSQCQWDEEEKTMTIPEWLVEKRKLI